MSLRLRLMLGLVGLVALALIPTDVVAYLVVQSSLNQQIDTQLTTSVDSVYRCLETKFSNSGAPCLGVYVPPGTYAELVPGSGGPSFTVKFTTKPNNPPRLPAGFGSNAGTNFTFTTAPASSGGGEFRVLEVAASRGAGLVVSMPLANQDATLDQLRLLEILVSAGLLLVMGGLAWWTVQLGLRPLRQIRDTAQKIAAGDLSQRVVSTDPRTEVGQLASSLNEMLAQIEQAFQARFASEDKLRQFVADASHELRTPLTSIRGYAELFRHGAKANPEDLSKAMTRIESESQRMSQLVDDLLLLARLDEAPVLERRPTDLAVLAVDAVADASAADKVHPMTVVAPAAVEVYGDEPRLRQVVANLVRNAVVHTPAGTAVEVSVERRDQTAILTVADHGPGVPAELSGRIFERFVRGGRARGRTEGGSGLGLAIVTAIVAGHQGSIALEETSGGGATFRVELPTLPPDQQPEVPAVVLPGRAEGEGAELAE